MRTRRGLRVPQPRADGGALPGMVARHDGVCERCEGPIVASETRVVFHRGRAIHVQCASGYDDGEGYDASVVDGVS